MRTPIAIALIAATAAVASVTSVSAVALVTGDDIQDNTVTSKDIKNGTLGVGDLKFDPHKPARIHSNHQPTTKGSGRAEGDWVVVPVDGSWGTMETIVGLPAGNYLVQATMGMNYNMQGAFSATCGFTTSTNPSRIIGAQVMTIEQVANKTNVYQQFNMSPMVLLTLPSAGDVNLICYATYKNNGSPRASQIYMYAQPVGSVYVD